MHLLIFSLLASFNHSLRAWKAASGTEPQLQMEGETGEEEQSRLEIELTLVHIRVTGTLNGLQISGLVQLPFQQNIMNSSFHRTPGSAGICRSKAGFSSNYSKE